MLQRTCICMFTSSNTEALGDTLSHIAIQFKGLEVELWNSIITIL